MEICVKIDLIQNVQHLLCDVDSVLGAELNASFGHGAAISAVVLSLSPLYTLLERFEPFHILDSNDERGMVLPEDRHVKVVDRYHRLKMLINPLRTLHHSTYMALKGMSDQMLSATPAGKMKVSGKRMRLFC